MNKSFVLLIIFFTLNNLSAAWIEERDEFLISQLNYYEINCEFDISSYHSLPLSISSIYQKLKEHKYDGDNLLCDTTRNKLLNKLFKKFTKSINIIGYQSKIQDTFLQDRTKRYYQDQNMYLSHSNINNNFAYNITLRKINNDASINIDDSYISYKYKNTIFKFGKYNKWWSSSNETSLILSNTARPLKSISISNYDPYEFKNFFEILGKFNYEIFLGKLEKDRAIPNSLLFGNRFSFSPSERIDVSLLRAAQFGGDGRPTDSQTLIDLILGKDTTNSNLSFEEQPGNQIAGIEASIKLLRKKNLQIFTQYLGEDGLDPIIDDRWIGAIFPSKRFSHSGINYFFPRKSEKLYELSAEFIDTDTGYKNVIYNHNLYLSGYRYKGKPIGANIDADSERMVITLKIHSVTDANKITFKVSRNNINENSSDKNYIYSSPLAFNEFQFTHTINLFKRTKISSNFIFRDKDTIFLNKNNFFIRIEYSL